jgi:hypothetical protein
MNSGTMVRVTQPPPHPILRSMGLTSSSNYYQLVLSQKLSLSSALLSDNMLDALREGRAYL